MQLDPTVLNELRSSERALSAEGKLPSEQKLAEYYATFRTRFGPERLASLDGDALLTVLHENNQQSLIYWLEWKNDDELPDLFGGIAGGSALKFGIYRRRDTGEWMTGSSTSQRAISNAEAIEFARRHRDQLIRAADVLQRSETGGADDEYRRLQRDLEAAAPDIIGLMWVHKYFSLLFPNKVDVFHSVMYQHFELLKLLQRPPEGDGRYVAAGRFVSMTQELGVPLLWLALILVHRNGPKYRYWRVGTTNSNTGESRWTMMRDNGIVAVGWDTLGDVIPLRKEKNVVETLKNLMIDRDKLAPTAAGKGARQLLRFLNEVVERDVVIAMEGLKVLGIGRVVGDVEFDGSSDFPFRRPVEWLDVGEWKLPEKEGLRTTVCELKKVDNLLEFERRLAGEYGKSATKPTEARRTERLSGIPGRVQAALARKGQVILYGPPGTGKTYWAERTAYDLAAIHEHRKEFRDLSDEQKSALAAPRDGKPNVRFCCFHPAYGYEDFIEGYRPEQVDGKLSFKLRPGIFRQLCEDAESRPDRTFFLIIDEINRGDIPRIFGELLTVLEFNKRGKVMQLPVSGQQFRVPANVRVIGTMNTADRSIALLDTALRRRFGFIELMPDAALLNDVVLDGIPLGPWLEALNQRICANIGRDARNLQVGHSYFLDGERPVSDFASLSRIVQEDIIPLLEEYCYEDFSLLKKILGHEMVDEVKQSIRHELFTAEGKEKLAHALMAPCPDLAALPQATAASDESPVEDEDEEAAE